ncbi:MAG: prephenate/arogenate dehydrogenase family protein [Pseudomonadota bacterium]
MSISEKTSPLFPKVTLIGLGLMGSSLCHAMRRKGIAGHISGHDHNPETREKAFELKLVDDVFENPTNAIKEADLIILCVPVGGCGEIVEDIKYAMKPGAILTDVGSVKSQVITDILPHLPEDVHFIPGHPVAGTEYSGPEAGFAELYDGRWCILTPLENTDPGAIAKLTTFWQSCGSSVEIMSAEHHDKVLAITSHIPHLIAYNIVGTASELEHDTLSEVIKFSAGGFRDFTRIASSDPVMWRDIFLNNKEAVLEMLGRFSEDLSALQRAIRRNDGQQLFDHFARTRAIRQSIIEAGQETDVPDFGRPHKSE